MRGSRLVISFALGGALGAGAAWLWRNQGDIGARRPFNEWTFTHMRRIMPIAEVRAEPGTPLPAGPPLSLDEVGYGTAPERTLAELISRNHVTGLAVLHRGMVVHESYPGRFASPAAHFQLFSLTKSVTSLLVGIANSEGDIPELDGTVEAYLPELAGSAYATVTIRQLLNMTSGVGGPEDWTDADALIHRYERAVMNAGSVFEVVRSAPRVANPGARFNYSTVDTHVLGWVLEAAVGSTLAEYLGAKIWRPIGAESDAFYFLSRADPRSALGGGSLNATLRDLARVGQLVAQGGEWEGQQVVPQAWIEAMRDGDVPGLGVGDLDPAYYAAHYGYSRLWWRLGGETRQITGLGVHGQFLVVAPDEQVVIAVTGAWSDADDDVRDAEMIEAARAVIAHLSLRPR